MMTYALRHPDVIMVMGMTIWSVTSHVEVGYAPPPQGLGLQCHKSLPSPVFPQAATTAAVVNAHVTLDILNNSTPLIKQIGTLVDEGQHTAQ